MKHIQISDDSQPTANWISDQTTSIV